MAVTFHLPPVEKLPVESCQQHVPVPELPLKGHVMDGENGRRLFETWCPPIFDIDQCRDESRLPVVGVYDLGIQVQHA